MKQREEPPHQNVHLNGEREVTEEEKKEEEHDDKSDSYPVSETQIDQDVAAEKEADKVTESKTQSQEDDSVSTDPHPVSSAELKPQETAAAAAESELQHELADSSVLKTSTEEKDTKSADPHDGPGQSSPREDGQETVVSERISAVSTEMVKENLDDGGRVGGINAAAQKAFGPPENPPPPPSALQNSSEEATG